MEQFKKKFCLKKWKLFLILFFSQVISIFKTQLNQKYLIITSDTILPWPFQHMSIE